MLRSVVYSFFSLAVMVGAHAIEVQAPYVHMIDFKTGAVLYSKNADQKMIPSSMSKILTAYLVFERLKRGDIHLEDKLYVSEKAWRTGGSKMFVPLNSQASVEDLIKGMIVQSGNDACIVLAEGLSGSEEAFAEEMTKKAYEMGAAHTHCANATGWPDEGHFTTARDLALISFRTIQDFPEYYAQYYAIQDFTYNKIKQGNRNTLLTKGADGIKTGHTERGGYGIAASAKQGDRRLILVINGLPTASAREKEALALLNWGFAHFKNYKLFRKGDVVDNADVWGGVKEAVALVPAHDVVLTLSRDQRPNLRVKVIYHSPLAAPIKAGDEVGNLELTVLDKEIQKIPLYAAQSVEKADFFQRIKNSLTYLLWGKHKL